MSCIILNEINSDKYVYSVRLQIQRILSHIRLILTSLIDSRTERVINIFNDRLKSSMTIIILRLSSLSAPGNKSLYSAFGGGGVFQADLFPGLHAFHHLLPRQSICGSIDNVSFTPNAIAARFDMIGSH